MLVINTHAPPLSTCAQILKQTCEGWTHWILERIARKTTWKFNYWLFLDLQNVEFNISFANQPFYLSLQILLRCCPSNSKCFSVFWIVEFAQYLQLSSSSQRHRELVMVWRAWDSSCVTSRTFRQCPINWCQMWRGTRAQAAYIRVECLTPTALSHNHSAALASQSF